MTTSDIIWSVFWLAIIGAYSFRLMSFLIVLYVLGYMAFGMFPHSPRESYYKDRPLVQRSQ